MTPKITPHIGYALEFPDHPGISTSFINYLHRLQTFGDFIYKFVVDNGVRYLFIIGNDIPFSLSDIVSTYHDTVRAWYDENPIEQRKTFDVKADNLPVFSLTFRPQSSEITDAFLKYLNEISKLRSFYFSTGHNGDEVNVYFEGDMPFTADEIRQQYIVTEQAWIDENPLAATSYSDDIDPDTATVSSEKNKVLRVLGMLALLSFL